MAESARKARAVAARSTSNISMPSISVPVLGDISAAATRIVNQTANILEEEVAAGILAARHVESRFVDVEEARAPNAAELISRIRKDAHELIDILVDLVGAAGGRATGAVGKVVSMTQVNEAGDIASRGNGAGSRTKSRSADASLAVSVLSVPQPIAPGASAEVTMMVENEGVTPTGRFAFRCSDLLGPDGYRIAPDAVRFRPATLALEPESTAHLKVMVKVPEGTPPGSYSGMLQATKLSRLKAILSFEVA